MSTLSEKIKKLNDSIYLTEAEREQMDGVITNFMDLHPLENPNMIKSEKQSTYFSFYAIWGRKLAFAVITLVVIFGASGGVVFASNDALPGDLLYPVKINVAEEIKSAMIFSTKEKANWEAERLQLRLAEMQQVVARTGSLSSELVRDTEARVLVHTEKVSEAAKNLEKMGDTKSIYEILDRIQTSLDEYNGMLQGLMEQNLPVNQADVERVIAQVASTEQNVRLAQQQNVNQINEVSTRNDFGFVNENPEYGKIVFSTPNKNSHVNLFQKFDITWNAYKIPAGTPGFVSLYYPSGKKAFDLYASPDIAHDPNQISWITNQAGILPGTFKLRMDLNKDDSGQYWYSDVFVIESNGMMKLLPDLEVTYANLSNYHPKIGEQVTALFDVLSKGIVDYEAKHSFSMTVTHNGQTIYTDENVDDDTCANSPVLARQDTCTAKGYFTPQEAGDYAVIVSAVYQDYAPESFKGNNSKTLYFTVGESLSVGNAVKVIAPTEGIQLKAGDRYLLKWQIIDLQGLTNEEGKFDLYTSNGKFVKTIIPDLPNLTKGNCYWNVETNLPNGKYFIRIGVNDSVYGDSQVFNIDNSKPILPPGNALKVIAPVMAQKIPQGTEYLLKWQVVDLQGLDDQEGKIDLYTADNQLVQNITTLPALYKGTYIWTVGNIKPGKYYIRIGINDQVYGHSYPFNIVTNEQQPTVQHYTGYLGEFSKDEFAGVDSNGFSPYIELENSKGTQIALNVCDKKFAYFNDFINTTIKTGLKTDVYGKKSGDGSFCVTSIAVVVPLIGTPGTFTGNIKRFTDGGYGSFSNYLQLADESKVGITTCDKRVFSLEQLIETAIQSTIPVDIIGTKTNGGICVTGIIARQDHGLF